MKKRKMEDVGIMGMTKAGIGLGAGSVALSSVGASPSILGNIARFMPAAGSAIGAGFLIRSMSLLKPKKSRKSGYI